MYQRIYSNLEEVQVFEANHFPEKSTQQIENVGCLTYRTCVNIFPIQLLLLLVCERDMKSGKIPQKRRRKRNKGEYKSVTKMKNKGKTD